MSETLFFSSHSHFVFFLLQIVLEQFKQLHRNFPWGSLISIGISKQLFFQWFSLSGGRKTKLLET